VDALAQVVQRRQVLAPVVIERLQQHMRSNCRMLGAVALDLGLVGASARLRAPLAHDVLVDLGLGLRARPCSGTIDLPVARTSSPGRQVPLLLDAVRPARGCDRLGHGLAQVAAI
jgi:hypothetical protein